jgi:Flp pilus assembly protein TadD
VEALEQASLLDHGDGSCGVTWLEREGDSATARTRQFASHSDAESFARGMGLEPVGPEMALAMSAMSGEQAWEAARSGRWAEAEEHIRATLRITPDHGDMHRLLGITMMRQGVFDEAVAELEAAVRLIPGDGAALHNLGVCHGLLGHRDRAIVSLEEAATAGAAGEVGSDLIRLLQVVGGAGDDPATVHATQTVVRHYLETRSRHG